MNRPVFAATAALALLAAACSGDDDAADSTPPSTTEPVEITATVTTDPPDTTAPPTDPPDTTTTSTTVPPTTTIDEEALKAQIVADYQRSRDLRTQLTENPTLDNLDATLAQIAVPDSDNFNTLKNFITGMVERGEHVRRGEPDFFRTDIENVELIGSPPYTEAIVTICYVSNRVRVDAAGNVLPDTGPLVAARSQDTLTLTPGGWLAAGEIVDIWQGLDVTECPPA